jgi:hypothetical protein
MPTHLEEMELSEKAYNLITKLRIWLGEHGVYKQSLTMNYFEECISEGLEKQTFPLSDEVVRPTENVMDGRQRTNDTESDVSTGSQNVRSCQTPGPSSGRLVPQHS